MPKAKAPSFQFYPSDWRSDGALHGCSIGARGMWMEMICLMHDSPKYGYLLRPDGSKFPEDQMLRTMGVCERDYLVHIAELRSAGVFSETSEGIIFSRRMIRDEENRREWRKCKQHQRSIGKVVHHDVLPVVHKMSNSPSSSPPSSIHKEVNHAAETAASPLPLKPIPKPEKRTKTKAWPSRNRPIESREFVNYAALRIEAEEQAVRDNYELIDRVAHRRAAEVGRPARQEVNGKGDRGMG